MPVYTQTDIGEPSLVLPSIGELVTVWIELLDRGVWSRAPDGPVLTDWTKVPAEYESLSIV